MRLFCLQRKNKYMKGLIVIICVMVFASAGFSQRKIKPQPSQMPQKNADTTVFGLKLGEKFNLPECNYILSNNISVVSPTGSGFYADLKNTCFKRLSNLDEMRSAKRAGKILPTPTNAEVVISFAAGERPVVLDSPKVSYESSELFAEIVDGYLEEISFATYGIANEATVLDALKTKYGDPTTFASEKLQNRYGAMFDSFAAEWRFPNLVATFSNILKTTDNGIVKIQTIKRYELLKTKEDESLKKKRIL
jgi:hypothetical protein